MRTLFAALMSVALLAGAAAPALGQAMSQGQEMKTVSGTVKSTAKDGFVVTSKDGEKDREYAFSIDGKTTVRKNNQTSALSDLKPGDRVTVNYAAREGKSFAHAVTVARP
jgi:PDZ domain-containing secreted protein